MKLNRVFTFAVLGTTMFLATSCSDDFSYEGPGAWDANANFADVYFPIVSSAEEVDPADPTTATIELCRRNTSGTLSVPITVVENTDEVFEISNANFADGDSVATITINYPKADVGTAYKLGLKIEGAEYTSSYSENTSFTYTVTRVKWNDAGYIMDGDEKIEGYAMYTDDYITTFFGVENVSFPTRLQERDDRPGYFRMINTYHENYPYNDPGDWDTSKDYYIFIDATDPTKVFIPELCETGMDWGYDMIKIHSFAGYYLERNNKDAAEEYYGTYANGAITFPVNSLLINMDGYKPGSLYTANGSGAFKLVIDPSKDLYTATVEDYDFSELLFAGEFTSAQLGTKKAGVAIYKGTPKEEVEAANAGCYDRFEEAYGGTPYVIKSPYTNGYDLLFLVNGGRVIAMPGYELQETGLTALSKDVYAAIQGTSKFSENEISLDITFQSKPNSNGEYTDFGTATETLANITWTKVGTGTYTYTYFFADYDEETEEDIPVEDGPLDIYQRDDDPTIFKVLDWGYGAEFMFTWDGQSKVTVPASSTGYVHPSYGTVYVSDFPTYNGNYSYDEYPCTYDAATQTFAFYVNYWVSAGTFGGDVETLKVNWDAAAAARSAKVKSSVQVSSNLKLSKGETPFSNRFVGKKVQMPKHGEFKNPGAPIF